jgi:aspartyl-tRNA(Asn)/glutamyl-tRNA(Gln) amidotransferase subunit C
MSQNINIKALSNLAKISLDETESLAVQEKLLDIKKIIDEVANLELDSVEPHYNPLDREQVLRPDEVTEKDQSSELQKNAPETIDGYYVVPQVVD